MLHFLSFAYLTLVGVNIFTAKYAAKQSFLYFCTGTTLLMDFGYMFFMKNLNKNFLLRIEFDLESEQLVVVRPKGFS